MSKRQAQSKAGPSSKPLVVGRLPQAPSSLLVQLPPDELKKFQQQKQSRTDGSSQDAYSGGSIAPSDIQLLAHSIQERREREARVFVWQQRLIDADESLKRVELKRALTQLSLSSWLQVLQERHLDNRCAYPGCSRKPKKPHLSSRQTVLPLDAPRYRISLASRSIRRDERDDPGGENGYCSKACWRRGEWISRWVLEGTSALQEEEEKKRKAGKKSHIGSVISNKTTSLGSEVDEGGRWERLIDEDNWDKIELLEDLEESGDVDRLSDDERGRGREQDGESKDAESLVVPSADVEVQQGAHTSTIVPPAAETTLQGDLSNFSSMLDSLAVVERASGQISDDASKVDETWKPSQSRRVRLVESKGRRGNSDAHVPANKAVVFHDDEEHEGAAAHLSDADSDDIDVLGELSLRSTKEDGDDVVSTILRSSRHLQKIDDEGDMQHAGQDDGADLTEDDHKRLQEEDDLFALAWQARDEERQKGNWVD